MKRFFYQRKIKNQKVVAAPPSQQVQVIQLKRRGKKPLIEDKKMRMQFQVESIIAA
jgi:hypothetical protein